MSWNAFIVFVVMPVLTVLMGYAALLANDWAIRREDRRAAERAAATGSTPAEAPRQG